MTLKKFYVGVKGIIETDKGYLVLKHESGHYDIPGGRIDDDENLQQALNRELVEELPDIKDVQIGEIVGAYRLHMDIDQDTGLLLVHFLIQATLPDEIRLSSEHVEFLWIKTNEQIPEEMNPDLKQLLGRLL